MTAKQLAERLGVDPKCLDFEFGDSCKDCKKTGGSRDMPCTDFCDVTVIVTAGGGICTSIKR
jgi:hypothetical protein